MSDLFSPDSDNRGYNRGKKSGLGSNSVSKDSNSRRKWLLLIERHGPALRSDVV